MTHTRTIYLVVCAGGSYEDAFECNIAAYTQRSEAERVVEICQSYVTEEIARRQEYADSEQTWGTYLDQENWDQEYERMRRWKSPFDPRLAWSDVAGARYYIESLELME